MTAMQELIKQLEVFKPMCSTDGEKFIINYAINNAKSRIEKEKEQIIEAYDRGFEDVNGEIYYKETYIDNVE